MAIGSILAGLQSFPAEAANSNFHRTCTQIEYALSQGRPAINAVCRKLDGTWQSTRLVLTRISNNNGLLVNAAGASTFHNSCGHTFLTISPASVAINAICRKVDGSFVASKLILSDIKNNDGRLIYQP